MRFYLDTEFSESAGTIRTISIGLVADDGGECYVENADFDFSDPAVDPWLAANVQPHLRGGECAVAVGQMKDRLTAYFAPYGEGPHELWGYNAAYDGVVFCSAFGRMIDMPKTIPHTVFEIKQAMAMAGVAKSQLPPVGDSAHDALADARWNRLAVARLIELGALPPAHESQHARWTPVKHASFSDVFGQARGSLATSVDAEDADRELLIGYYTTEACAALALALHRDRGLELGVLYDFGAAEDFGRGEEPCVAHVFVHYSDQLGNRFILDAKGTRAEEDVRADYSDLISPQFSYRVPEKELLDLMGDYRPLYWADAQEMADARQAIITLGL